MESPLTGDYLPRLPGPANRSIFKIMIPGLNNMIQKIFNGAVRQQIQDRAGQFGLKGQEAIDVITTTKNTVKEVLHAELQSGRYNEVLTLLKNSALQSGKKVFFDKQVFFDKIIQRVVGRLMVRFGLPQTVAFTLATLLVPFILKRLGKKALKSGKVQDLLHSLGVMDQLEKFKILKHQVKGKFATEKKAAA